MAPGGIESRRLIFTDREEERKDREEERDREREREREREMNDGPITPHVVNLKSRQGGINHLNP